MNKSRLRWQCRRGMRELDELVVWYLETRFDDADDEQKSAFQALLELPDPELMGYLLGKQMPEQESIRGVVESIRSRNPE
ncbi:MAG: succinate dehydrogenase assembly factor 2 [Woeseiaceae bacterium]